jgi:hypothetical protein
MSAITDRVHHALVAYIRDVVNEDNTELHEKFLSLSDEQIIRMMFSNYRAKGAGSSRGLRLTKFGLQIMKNYFQGYECKMPEGTKLLPLHLLYLDSKASMPYYCSNEEGFVIYDRYLGTKLKLADGKISTLMEIESNA